MMYSHIQLFNHRVIRVDTLARAASMTSEEMRLYLDYMTGLLQILTLPDHYYHEWVMYLYATVWFESQHRFIEYMLMAITITGLASLFGARAEGVRIHQLAYPNVDPPRCPYSKGIYM